MVQGSGRVEISIPLPSFQNDERKLLTQYFGVGALELVFGNGILRQTLVPGVPPEFKVFRRPLCVLLCIVRGKPLHDSGQLVIAHDRAEAVSSFPCHRDSGIVSPAPGQPVRSDIPRQELENLQAIAASLIVSQLLFCMLPWDIHQLEHSST